MHWAILNKQKNLRKPRLNDLFFPKQKGRSDLSGRLFLLFIVSGDNGCQLQQYKKAG